MTKILALRLRAQLPCCPRCKLAAKYKVGDGAAVRGLLKRRPLGGAHFIAGDGELDACNSRA